MGKKSGDEWVVPLCRPCHNAVHMHGSKTESEFFAPRNEKQLAISLWDNTGDLEAMQKIMFWWMI